MEARYFRYQYENTQDGIIQSGCIWDAEYTRKTIYLYMAGEYTKIPKTKRKNEGGLNIVPEESTLDLFVLGAYTIPYIRRLIEILQERKVRTVVLPYVPPTIRSDVVTYLKEANEYTDELKKFLGAPYAYLKAKGVENVYLLYGNGPIFNERSCSIEEGHYFKRTDRRIQEMISEMEGVEIPIYQAGYIVENEWLYYFGFYSVDVPRCGITMSLETITMFSGPIHHKRSQMDCRFSSKVFTREQRCNIEIKGRYETCALKCLYRNDYDRMKKHMDENHEVLKVGLLNLGNVNLNISLNNVIARYAYVLKQVRGISVPNCGNWKNWNKKLLSVFAGVDIQYFVCAGGKNTDSDVIRDIVMYSTFNRFINVNEEFAQCFSGYIIPKEEN